MGQSLSAPTPSNGLHDFVNLPKEAIESLWTSYNLLGEGWSLTSDDLKNIFISAPYIATSYSFSDTQLSALFDCFDTDNNGLIDALELFITVALVSGMDTIDKIYFAFNAYDFDNVGSLSFDESNLLLRSVVKGLGKASKSSAIFNAPTNLVIGGYVDLIFKSTNRIDNSRLQVSEFKSYCSTHPVLSSWLKVVGSFPPEVEKIAPPESISPSLNQAPPLRSTAPKKAYEPIKISSVISNQDYDSLVEAIATAAAIAAAKPVKKPKTDDEDVEEDSDEGKVSEKSVAPVIPLPSWATKADYMKPDELPTPLRTDPVEDVFEPVWVFGMTTSTKILRGVDDKLITDVLHQRCARYAQIDEPVPGEPGEDGEVTEPKAPNAVIIYTAANHLISVKKQPQDDPSAPVSWSQSIFTEHHDYPITCFDIIIPYPTATIAADYSKSSNFIITADNYQASIVGSNPYGANSKIVIWDARSFAVLRTILTSYGVNFLDVSKDGKLILAVLADSVSTIHVYSIDSGKSIFSVALFPCSPSFAPSYNSFNQTKVLDIKWTGTSSMFVVGTSKGVRFFVDDGVSFMGVNGMRIYEEKIGLYQALGKDAKEAAVSSIARFENVDEIVTGTEKGQILLWKGRTCSQLLTSHKSTVNTIDFESKSKTLVSGSADGVINIYQITSDASVASNNARRDPKIVTARLLIVSATFDIFAHNLSSFNIRSLSLFPYDASKVLVATSGNELLEVSVRGVLPPPPKPPVEAVPAADGEEPLPADGDADVPEEVTKQEILGRDMNGGIIVTSHLLPSEGDVVSSLCRVPNLNGFASGGGDGTVRLWQTTAGDAGGTACKQVKQLKIDCSVSAIDASPTALAVALSSGPRVGTIQLFTQPELTFIAEFKDTTKPYHELRFSPDGNALVGCSGDGNVYVYHQTVGETGSTWALKGKFGFSGTSAAGYIPQRVDFSSDGLYIRSSYSLLTDPTNEKEFKVWDVSPAGNFGKDLTDITFPAAVVATDEDGESNAPPPPPGLEILKSITWASNFCPLSWDTKSCKGIYLPVSQDGLPLAFDRSQHLFVSSQLNGSVAIDRVPAVSYSDVKISYSDVVGFAAHIGKVSSAVFVEESGAKLVTSGGRDGLIKVFKVNYDLDEFEPDVEDEGQVEEEVVEEPEEDEDGNKKPPKPVLYDSGEDEDFIDIGRLKEHLPRIANVSADAVLDGSAKYDIVNGWLPAIGLKLSDALQSCKTALGTEIGSAIPSDELQLDWVYGSSTRQTRAAVHYTNEGSILYPAGSIAVIYDKLTHQQKYFMPHIDEITAIDVHLGSGLAASASKGEGDIQLSIWETKNTDGVILKSISCGQVNGISAVKFSSNGQFIFAAAQDPIHSVLIFRVSDGSLIASTAGGSKKILALACSESVLTSPIRVLQGGISHFKLLSFIPSQGLINVKSGSYGSGVKKTNTLCVASLPLQPTVAEEGSDGGGTGNEFVIGMSDGSLGLISRNDNKVAAFNPIHKGPITAICIIKNKDGTIEEPPVYKIVTGGKDGFIRILDGELSPTSEFNLYDISKNNLFGLYPNGRFYGFRSLSVNKLGNKILYSTAASEINELDVPTGQNVNGTIVDVNGNIVPLVNSNYRSELRGLCSHPFRDECITIGADKILRIWDLAKKTIITSIELPDIGNTASFAPNGQLIAVGLGNTAHLDPINPKTEPRKLNGNFLILSYLQSKLNIIYLAVTSTAADLVTTTTFSPDGTRLYVGTRDGSIYVYDALNNFKTISTLASLHENPLDSIDITYDGKFIVSMSKNEVVIWDTLSFTPIKSPTDKFEYLAGFGLDYFTRQGVYGINCVGVFPQPVVSHGNNVFLPEVTSLTQSATKSLLATGDNYGQIKLFSNPAIDFFSPNKRYLAHSRGGISKVVFSHDDSYLLSIGKTDRLLVQWKVLKESTQPDVFKVNDRIIKEIVPVLNTNDMNGNFFNTFIMKSTVDFTNICNNDNTNSNKSNPVQCNLKSIVGVGNNFAAASVIPMEEDGLYPALSLSIIPAAYYCGHGEIVTSFGKVAAVLDGSKGPLPSQKVWSPTNNSSDSIVSVVAVSTDGRLVGVSYYNNKTGTSSLLLYSAPIGEIVHILEESIPGCIQAMKFSYDAKFLACVSNDEFHTLHVFKSINDHSNSWSYSHNTQVSRGDINQITFIAPIGASVNELDKILPSDLVNNTPHDPFVYHLATAGNGNIKFYRIDGTNLVSTYGNYHSDSQASSITALASLFHYGLTITGDKDGKIHLWKGKHRSFYFQGTHNKAITALATFESSKEKIISGSYDGVKVWNVLNADINSNLLFFITFESIFNRSVDTCGLSSLNSSSLHINSYVTAISSDVENKRILLSLSSSALLLVSTDSNSVQSIAEGISSTVNGITTHLTDPNLLVTVSSDKVVRLWDVTAFTIDAGYDEYSKSLSIRNSAAGSVSNSSGKNLAGILALSHVPTSCAFYTDSILLVGITHTVDKGNSGAILIVNCTPTESSESQASPVAYQMIVADKIHNIGVGAINMIRLSPNKQVVAAASTDGNVYIYQLPEEPSTDAKEFRPLGFLLAHPTGTPVVGLDFSTSSRFVRTFGTNNAKYNIKVEVNYFDFELSGAASAGMRKHAAGKIQDITQLEVMKTTAWATVSSAGAPEVRGISYNAGVDMSNTTRGPGEEEAVVEGGILSAQTVCKNSNSGLVCAGYDDGSMIVYRGPHVTSTTLRSKVNFHSNGAVLTTFSASSKGSSEVAQIVSVGRVDGTIMVWKVV
eukprot:gene9336-12580_t